MSKKENSKTTTPISEIEYPHIIPDTWIWKRLGECGTFISGYTPKQLELSDSGLIPYFKVSDMNRESNQKYMKTSLLFMADGSNNTKKVFSKGTIVYPKNGGALFTNKKRILVSDSVVDLNTGGFLPNSELDTEYMYLYFLNIDFRKCHKGSALPTIDQEKLRNYLVPVPPLEEQKRIVARIEELFSELDAAVATLEQTKEQLAVYRQAVLKEAFEGEWTYQLVTDVISSDKHSMVIGPFGSDLKVSDYCESGVPLVFVKDIRDNFSDKPREYVSVEKAEKLSAHKVSYGDLLITKMGNPPGDCVIYPNNVDAIITADCIKVTVNPEIVNAKYLMYYILSSFGKRQVDEMTCGVAQKKMSLKRFKSFTLPKISLLEQDEIVSEIESHLSVCDKIEETVNTALQEAEAMRQSILKQAFAGEL